MELKKEHILKIFKQNFPFDIVETPLGTGIKMPVKDAFIFSSITGAGYLDNPILPFTPKGLLKLFYNAFDYKFVTGIFDNGSLKNTPYLLYKAKPFLFDSDYKTVIPYEFESDYALQKELRRRIINLKNPTDYIIQRIETSKKGNGLESFLEYIASFYFSKKGYICENQIPLSHSTGSPDFGGYLLKDFSRFLYKNKLFDGGFNIIELSLLRIFNERSNNSENKIKKNHIIVGEAKTSTSSMTKQLEKYLKTSLFDEGFEIHPSKQEPARQYFGLLSFDKDLIITYKQSILSNNFKNPDFDKNKYHNWLNNYMKYYLIANMDNDEFISFFKENTGNNDVNDTNIAKMINNISLEKIIIKLKDLRII